MNTLAFDTATEATVVALSLGSQSVSQLVDVPTEGQRAAHTGQLLKFADRLLAEAELEWQQLDRIAVGVGPGSFTGLRIALATAEGLRSSLKVELVAVPTLDVLLRQAELSCVVTDPVVAVVDARRGESFIATGSGDIPATAPIALGLDRLAEYLADSESSVCLYGPPAQLLAEQIGDRLRIKPTAVAAQLDGEVLLELAVKATPLAGSAEPIYVREPDAKPFLPPAVS